MVDFLQQPTPVMGNGCAELLCMDSHVRDNVSAHYDHGVPTVREQLSFQL
jgi:hypothetical protein